MTGGSPSDRQEGECGAHSSGRMAFVLRYLDSPVFQEEKIGRKKRILEGATDASSYLTFRLKNPFFNDRRDSIKPTRRPAMVLQSVTTDPDLFSLTNTQRKFRTYMSAVFFALRTERNGFTRLEKISCKNSVALYRPSRAGLYLKR